MKFGVIGHGIVGGATAKVWETVGEVRTWDIDPYKASHSFAKVAECDYVFVCVPTPGTENGPLDCSAVMEVATKLSVLEPTCAVIRSTVNVGTTRKFQEKSGWPTVFWPEFLSMRTAERDALEPICSLIGYNNRDGEKCEQFATLVAERFPQVTRKFFHVDDVEAAKLFSNAYGAAHVSLMNQIAHMAARAGLEWKHVLTCLKATGRINQFYSDVPGHNGFGWSSHCWEKDLPAARAIYKESDCYDMLLAAWHRNKCDVEGL